MAKARYRYNITLRPEPDGYTALIPALPDCVTYGRTLVEARKMAKDAIEGYIESLRKHKEPVPAFRRQLGTRDSVLRSQLPQNLFPQLLRLTEEFLILDKQPV